MESSVKPTSGPFYEALPAKLAREVRAARKAKGMSIRTAAARVNCSPRFMQELEKGKPTARMDKVLQALQGLGLQLGVKSGAGQPGDEDAQSHLAAQAEARASQGLYEERVAGAHARIAAMLALGLVEKAQIERARGQVGKWAANKICSQWYVDQWTALLAGTDSEIASKILKLGKADARALFQNTPFGSLVRGYLRA